MNLQSRYTLALFLCISVVMFLGETWELLQAEAGGPVTEAGSHWHYWEKGLPLDLNPPTVGSVY